MSDVGDPRREVDGGCGAVSRFSFSPLLFLPFLLSFADSRIFVCSAHVLVTSSGSALLAANYGSGSVALLPLDPSTGLFLNTTSSQLYTFPFTPSTSPLRNLVRQEASHPHQIIEVPSSEDNATASTFFVNDLGQDKVWKFKIAGGNTGTEQKLEADGAVELKGEEGAGVRHSVVRGELPRVVALFVSLSFPLC